MGRRTRRSSGLLVAWLEPLLLEARVELGRRLVEGGAGVVEQLVVLHRRGLAHTGGLAPRGPGRAAGRAPAGRPPAGRSRGRRGPRRPGWRRPRRRRRAPPPRRTAARSARGRPPRRRSARRRGKPPAAPPRA